jgi:hypothetical protein
MKPIHHIYGDVMVVKPSPGFVAARPYGWLASG